MKKKLLPVLLIAFTIILSALIFILPSITGKNFTYITVKQELPLARVLNNQADIELVFFGYAGCLDVCTPRIEAIKQWYLTLSKKQQKRIGVRFFDLSIPKDPQTPDIFIKAFHKNFTGVYLSQKELRTYTKEFNVYFSDSLLKKGEINHSAHLYITKRTTTNKELRAIYTAFPYNFVLINSKLKTLLEE